MQERSYQLLPHEESLLCLVPDLPGSPWGAIDGIVVFAPGVALITTSSHGGFWLSRERLAAVPVEWREARFGRAKFAASPWFEEDCDWTMVALTFPELFPPEHVELATRIFDDWLAPELGEG